MAQVITSEHKRPNSKLISAIIAVIILIVGVFVGVYVIQNQQNIPSEAQLASDPLQVELSNITDTSFTVSWTTAEAVTGTLSYGEDEEVAFVARDKRDLYDQKIGQYITHYIQVVGLSPDRQYYFKITSGGKAFSDEGGLYKAKTSKAVSIPNANNAVTAYGNVTTDTGKPAEGAVVLFSSENMQLMSTLTDNQGKWSLNLASARNAAGTEIANLSESDIATIRVQGAKKNSSARISISQVAPAPSIQLGKSYDLSQVVISTNSDVQSRFDFINTLGAQEAAAGKTITIWSPQENEAIATVRPLFIGSAPTNTTITLDLDAGISKGSVIADTRGNWQWSAPTDLSISKHALKVSYINSQNVTIESVRNFTVAISGTQPAFESSPSATLTTTQAPTKVPTATPTRSPVVTKTAEISITPTKTPSVTLSPTKAPTASPTMVSEISITPTTTTTPTPTPTKTELPRAGVSAPTVAVSIGALVIFLIATLLVI